MKRHPTARHAEPVASFSQTLTLLLTERDSMPATFLDLKETGRGLFSVEQLCFIWEWLIVFDVSCHCIIAVPSGLWEGCGELMYTCLMLPVHGLQRLLSSKVETAEMTCKDPW